MSAADRGAIIVSLICIVGCILFSPILISTGVRLVFFVGDAVMFTVAWAYRSAE